MIDVSFLEQKAKELAKKSAGAVMEARLSSERSAAKQEASRSIESATEGRGAALTSLDGQAQQGMKGKAGNELSRKAGTIQVAAYHRDGAESIS